MAPTLLGRSQQRLRVSALLTANSAASDIKPADGRFDRLPLVAEAAPVTRKPSLDAGNGCRPKSIFVKKFLSRVERRDFGDAQQPRLPVAAQHEAVATVDNDVG